MRYEQIWDGDWFEVPRTGLQLGCCDCGLVHDVTFRIRKGTRKNTTLMAKFVRNNRSTGQIRRYKNN